MRFKTDLSDNLPVEILTKHQTLGTQQTNLVIVVFCTVALLNTGK